MAKKRTSLEGLLAPTSLDKSKSDEDIKAEEAPGQSKIKREDAKAGIVESETATLVVFKNEIVKQTVYLPAAVHEQLRLLAFEERRKMHDYLVEGLDRVFKDRGLKPFDELNNSKKQ